MCTSLLHCYLLWHRAQAAQLLKGTHEIFFINTFYSPQHSLQHLKWRLRMATVLVSPRITHMLYSGQTTQGQSLCSISECVSVFCCADDGDNGDDDYVCVLLCYCDFDISSNFLVQYWYKKTTFLQSQHHKHFKGFSPSAAFFLFTP